MVEKVDPFTRPGSAGISRRSLLTGVGAAAALFGLSGCVAGTTSDVGTAGAGGTSGPAGSGGASTSARPAELQGKVVFWTINLKKNYNDYITGLIQAYQAQQPKVQIDWVDLPGKDVDPKFLAALSSNDVPDVANLTNSSVAGYASRLLDLQTLMTPEDLAQYQPGMVDPFKVNGKQVAVPWYHGGAPVTLWRKSIMSKVSAFDPEKPPTNYRDLLALAQTVYDSTGTYGTLIRDWEGYLVYQGVKLISDDKKKAAFNTPEAIAAVEALKKAVDSKAMAPGVTSTQGIPPQWVNNGQVAFVVSEPFVLAGLKADSPQAYADMGVGMAPATTDGSWVLSSIQTFVIPSGAKNPAAGANFLTFVTNAKNQVDFCKIVPIYPSSVDAIKDPFFTDTSDTSPSGVAKLVIAKELPKSVYTGMGTTHDPELIMTLQDAIRGYLSGRGSASEALTTAGGKWDELLSS